MTIFKLIGALDLNLLRDVGTIINETVCDLEGVANPPLTCVRSAGRNPSLLLVFVSSSTSTRNWTIGNIYTLDLIPSSCVPTILPPRCQPFYETRQSKVAQQVAATAPEGIKSLNVVYFPQLGGSMATHLDVLDITQPAGFLICIPMLEEWSHEGRINDLDGWTFQV